MDLIRVSNAHKSYVSGSESNDVIKDFNMNVKQGTIYAVLGSSGCGKTTLFSCLVGLKSLDKGEILIFGEPPKANMSRIGYMPQDIALINDFTIREIIGFFGTIYGMKSSQINERLRLLSDLLEIPYERKLVRECSNGQQRRISLALTLIHEPELLILDEPTVGVDPLLRNKIWSYLIKLTSEKKVTVLLSTHYIEEAKQSTCIGVVRKGSLLVEESPDNILKMMKATRLDEAILKLSLYQAKGENNSTTKDNSNFFYPRI